jgi:hypothetical protein
MTPFAKNLLIGSIAVLLSLVLLRPAVGQKPQVRDLDFRAQDTQIVITYDLIGKQGKDYKVELLFSASGGRSFDYEPQAVSGAVGKDLSPGPNKTVTWNVLQDFPDGIQSPNAQFKLLYKKQGGGAWGWFIGALVAGGGGTAAGIATGILPCLSFVPAGLCPAADDEGPDDPTDPGGGSIPAPVGPPD